MSDLISRSAAIEEIWNIFNSYANDSSKFDEYETEAISKAFKVLQNCVENLPTAYDKEKVIRELEGYKQASPQGAIAKMQNHIFDEVIEVVKAGGIDG